MNTVNNCCKKARQSIYKELIDAIEGAKVVCDQPAWACNECPTFNKGLESAAQIIKQKQISSNRVSSV